MSHFSEMFALTKSETAKDFSVLLVGQVIAKGFAFLGTIAALRVLGPEELGDAGRVVAVVGVLGVLLSLGIDVIGPRIISSEVGPEGKGIAALSLLSLKCGLSAISLLFLLIWVGLHASRAVTYTDETPLRVWLAGSMLLIASSLNPLFILQGYGQVRRLALPQVSAALTALFGNVIVCLWLPRADVFLLVQALAAFSYAGLAIYNTGLKTLKIGWLTVTRMWSPVFGKEGRSAWLSSIAIYAFARGDLLSIYAFRNKTEMGNFNAALGLLNGTDSLLCLIPMVIYSRQLSWLRGGGAVFAERQAALLRAAIFFSGVAGALALVAGGPLARFLLGARFEHAAQLFAVLLSASLLNIPYAIMVSALNSRGYTFENLKITLYIAILSFVLYPVATYNFGLSGAVWTKFVLLGIMSMLQYYVYKVTLTLALTNQAPSFANISDKGA